MSQFSNRSSQSPDTLRQQDRIIRQILWQYPQVPRAIDDPWHPTRNSIYGFLVVSVVSFSLITCGLWSSVFEALQNNAFWQSPIAMIAAFVGPLFIVAMWYMVIHPVYAWNVGLRWGRPAFAVVTFIDQRRTPTSARGTWEVHIDQRRFKATFRQVTLEGATWIKDLREGDRINVLVHPTRDRVLLAYGP
jgi:hypothetical protein